MTSYQISKATRAEPDIKRKRTKKSKRQVVVKYADDCCAQYVKARDRFCVTCGSTFMRQWSHLFEGRHYSTRWREDCSYTQCKSCHHSHHVRSNLPLIRYAENQYSPAWIDELKRIDNQTVDLSSDAIREIGDKLKEKLHEIQKSNDPAMDEGVKYVRPSFQP
jgi:hypothetical protein